jgi:hypothetical protein
MSNIQNHPDARREHRLLVLLHWLTLPLVIAIIGLGAYRTWGLPGIRNRMDIVVITAVSPPHSFPSRAQDSCTGRQIPRLPRLHPQH